MPETIDGQTGKPDTPPRPKAPTAAQIPLDRAVDVRREMAKVYREMRGGSLDTSEGGKLVYALSAIGKMIEVHELEERIRLLEDRLESSKSAPMLELRPH